MTASATLAALMWLAAQQSADTSAQQITSSAGQNANVVATDQISAPAGSRTSTAQVGTPTRTVPAAPAAPKTAASNQLMVSKPSADAPASGSTPKQGRNTHTEAVKGNDSCDPQAAQANADACKTVIETRSAEFVAPDTEPLSPEQNLMVSQNALNETNRDVTSATRRLANGDVDDTNAGLAVSSFVTNNAPSDADNPKSESNPTTDAIISTVVGALQGTSH